MEESTKAVIEEKVKKASDAFDSISSELRKLEAAEVEIQRKKSELNVELFRLQGENRVLKDLLETK